MTDAEDFKERPSEIEYTVRERICLAAVAAVGFIGLNSAFLYSLFYRPDLVSDALSNPLAAAFVVEALLLTGVLAYLLTRWRVTRVHWIWFVVLSLLGSIAFALPVVAMAGWRDDQRKI